MTLLSALAENYPTADAALAEASALRAALSLPKGVVHVVSDVTANTRNFATSSTTLRAVCVRSSINYSPGGWTKLSSRNCWPCSITRVN
jgi:fructose-1,6-bisphosphatase